MLPVNVKNKSCSSKSLGEIQLFFDFFDAKIFWIGERAKNVRF